MTRVVKGPRRGCRDDIFAEYFSWLLSYIGDYGEKYDVLVRLYNTDFVVPDKVPDDQNRVDDALRMREVYLREWVHSDTVSYDFLIMNVNALEIFVALSVRCEVDIMQDQTFGDRTSQWFWGILGRFNLDNSAGIEKFFGKGGINQKRKRPIWAEMGDFLSDFV